MPIRIAVWLVQTAREIGTFPPRASVEPGNDAMKSPFGWCALLTTLLALWSGSAMAQDEEEDADDCVDSEISQIFQFAEPDSGFRFMADALYWTRSNSGSGGPVIAGPETFSLGNVPANNYVGGYRIGAAWMIDPNYEVEAVWTSFTDWTSTGNGILSRAIAFNGGQNSLLVDPSANANFINTGTFFRPVFDAAMDPLANPTIQNYAFLQGNSTYTLYSTSTLHDFQANFKSRRSEDRRYAFGVGYRNVQLNEGTSVLISGVFGTNDLPGGGNTHNVLTNDALTAHGLTLVSGAADGWTNGPGNATTLSLFWNGATTNQLNGVQTTLDAALYQRGIFMLEGVARTGIFMNRMTGTVREVYTGGGADNSVYGRTFTDNRDAVSFVGNLGLNGVVRMTDHIRLRGGYEVMVITNTAQAGDQQGGVAYNSLGTASYTVQGGNTVFLHGARAGVEVVW